MKAVLIKNKKIIRNRLEDLPNNLKDLLGLATRLTDELSAKIKPEKIGGIGFALASTLDFKRDKTLRSYNIEYLSNQPIKKLLEGKLRPYRIKIEQDTPCFLLAELKVGLAREFKNVFYFILGRGIGSAWAIDGKIFKGSHGAATEAGHMVLEMGQGWDLEEMASSKLVGKLLKISSEEAFKKARQGDLAAQEAFRQLGRNLGVGLANVINIMDPEAIILGGGVAEAKEFISPAIGEEIERYVISPAAKETKILFSQIGRYGGALGAALLFE